MQFDEHFGLLSRQRDKTLFQKRIRFRQLLAQVLASARARMVGGPKAVTQLTSGYIVQGVTLNAQLAQPHMLL
jgi:hypothetical protein